MKIAIITNLYPPYVRGGAEQVVVRTVESLTGLGHQVAVITGRPPGSRSQMRERVSTESVYRFYPKNIYFTLSAHKFPWLMRIPWHVIDALSPLSANKIKKILKAEKPDVVITHNLKGIGLSIARAVQKEGYPHAHIVHDLQLIYPSGLLFAGSNPKKWYCAPPYGAYRAICKRQFGTPDLVIFPSTYLQKTYAEHDFFKDSDAQTLANPAPVFPRVNRSSPADGRTTLLFVGQVEKHKGVGFLLDAIKKLPNNYKLIIAGEGRMSEDVKRAAKRDKRIIYLGFISIDQLLKCLAMADALIVPSLCYENSPTVIYEALSAGVPVLASNIGGVGELVSDGKNGFLFKPGSKEDFAESIQKLETRIKEGGFDEAEIRRSVSSYSLAIYTQKLIEKLSKIRQKNDTQKS